MRLTCLPICKQFDHRPPPLGMIPITHRFHDHGDTIAIQYGGSHLVNTMETYRKIKHWQSHSRDMVESFKRYYHNSFLDTQRQEAYNLFLGNYIYAQGQPMLWELTTDYYLHHCDPRSWGKNIRRDYVNWYTPAFLGPRQVPKARPVSAELVKKGVAHFDDYWLEYYRPVSISSLLKVYAFGIDSTARHLPDKSTVTGRYDYSPFCTRKAPADVDSPDKKTLRKGVTIVTPTEDMDHPYFNRPQTPSRPSTALSDRLPNHQSILRTSQFEVDYFAAPADVNSSAYPKPIDKTLIAQWTLNQFYHNSLNPTVTEAEAAEYEQYISHPLNLPLVVSTELPDEIAANLDLVDYINSASGVEDWTSSAGSNFGASSFDVNENDLADYKEFSEVSENPLTVSEEDGDKKRYKAYKKWLQGKSLFKQSKVDPEYQTEHDIGV